MRMAKSAMKQFMDADPIGTGMGLAVGSLIGLLGGPVGLTVGAVRDFWVAGLELDFIEEAQTLLLLGKVALLAEIEEEWVIPVDAALEAVGGQILRRTRAEVAEDRFDHDIATFNAEITELESEASHVGAVSKDKLHTKIAAAKGSLKAAVQRSQQRVDALKHDTGRAAWTATWRIRWRAS